MLIRKPRIGGPRSPAPIRSPRAAAILVACLVLLPSYVLSQDPSRADRPRADRTTTPSDSANVTSGSSTLREVDGERVLELKGGVTITRGDVTVRSDEGRQYIDRRLTLLIGNVMIDQRALHMEGGRGEYWRVQDKAVLRDNVRIVDDGWEITCDEAIFFRRSERAWLFGNVVAVDEATRIRADSLLYDKGTLYAEAFGNVSIRSSAEGVYVRGKHGRYYRDRGEAIIDVQPHLVVDPDSREPAFVDADTMMFYPDEDRAIAFGRVKIVKGNTITQCDSAVVLDREKRAILYGNPLAKRGGTSMESSRMTLRYNENEIDRIRLDGNAGIREAPADPLIVGRESWIHGDSMMLYLANSRIDSIRVSGNATSEYYPLSKTKVESNYARGDSMFFLLENDSIVRVDVTGKADGIYRYINLKSGETADSLRAVADTSLVYIPFDEKAEKVVYSADSIQFHARTRELYLNNNGKVVYKNRTLLGKRISYNADLQLLDAYGSPVLIEGPDKMYGDQMDYDMDSGVGLVRKGQTKFIAGYYQGEDIAKVGDNVLKVWNSTYTTCELKVPHYHFASRQMKVYLDDKVVTGPIVLYIGETPVFALPFFAQNIRQGRRSGVLRPDVEFGINSSGSRFIRNIGYYWATNDYTDFNFVTDFNEDQAIRLRIDNRYKLRYLLDGGLNFSWVRSLQDFTTEWTLSARHNQTLGEKFTLTSDLRFVSSENAQKSVSRLDEVSNIIDRRIESRVSLRKTWNTVGFSTSLRRVENLDVTDPLVIKVATVLPDVALSIPSRSLYFGKKQKSGYESFWQKTLDDIRFSPSLSMNRTTEERLYEFRETITSSQGLSFSSPQKVGFLSFSPTFSMRNNYTFTDVEITPHQDPQDTTVFVPGSRERNTENEFTWTAGAATSMKLYGTFYPTIGPLRGIRHTMLPAASYSYRPGRGGRPSTQAFSVNLNNTFDLKVRGEDEDSEPRKISGVLIWGLSSSYNPDAPSKKGWSTISSRMNLRAFGSTFTLNNSIDPYSFDILSTSVISSIVFRGTHGFGTAAKAEERELNIAASEAAESPDTTETASFTIEETSTAAGTEQKTEAPKEGMPWMVSASFSYNKPQFGDPRSTLNLNANFSMTRNWRVTYRTTYDLQGRELLGQFFSLARDLHCWEISFNRQELVGGEWNFYFKITLKGHPEIYADQGDRGLGAGSLGSVFQY